MLDYVCTWANSFALCSDDILSFLPYILKVENHYNIIKQKHYRIK
jgi:hypothetical protein